MIVADTSAWIDYFNGVDAPHTRILDIELLNNRVVIGDLIIAEFLQGFRDEKQYKLAKQLLDSLEYYDFVGRDIAYKAADNFRILRKNGITVRKTIDMLIGTFCIENAFELIHNDKDFDPLTKYLGLRVKKGL
jgi:predicted nucleic acid-binding protein